MFDMKDRITKQKFVLTTGNKEKVKEMADVLADFGFEVIAQTDLGIESPIESLFNFKTSYGCPVLQGFFIVHFKPFLHLFNFRLLCVNNILSKLTHLWIFSVF